MKTVVLTGSEVIDMRDIHKVFVEALDLPEHYGNNLDALYDCLSEQEEPVTVELCETDQMDINLGIHFDSLLRMLMDAAAEGYVTIAVPDEEVPVLF